MSLTHPNDFPVREGIDPRDEDHPIMPKKPPLKIYLKPLSQKIVEKSLWVETISVLMILITGIAEVFGRTLSSGWYVILGVLLALLGIRFFKREELPVKKEVPPAEPTEDKSLK